jgi:hypothetical protein
VHEEKKQREGLYKYGEKVKLAKLDLKCKALLWFYAYGYNWTDKKPSYYTQDQICAYVGFSPSTFQKTKQKLIDLGWIRVKKVAGHLPSLVTPKTGKDDSSYDSKSWAKGHKSNLITLQQAMDGLEPEYRDPFSA